MNADADTMDLLLHGKLDQTCPSCGMTEAAGRYCTADATPTGPAYWHPVKRSVAQRASAQRLGANSTDKSRRVERSDAA